MEDKNEEKEQVAGGCVVDIFSLIVTLHICIYSHRLIYDLFCHDAMRLISRLNLRAIPTPLNRIPNPKAKQS